MGTPTPLIVSVATPSYGRVVVEASDGKRYSADLSCFSKVYCFPQGAAQWSAVAPDMAGLSLVWTSRFEVHIDQVIGLADQVDTSRQSA